MSKFDKLKLNEHNREGNGVSMDHHAATSTTVTAEPLEIAPESAIPPELERAAADAGAGIRNRFQAVLSKPKAAQKAARVFLRGLRGPRKKPGRKPHPSTTKALRLLESLELQQMPKARRWQSICKQVVADWAQMTPEQRSGAAKVLQDRVYARRRMRRQRRERRTREVRD